MRAAFEHEPRTARRAAAAIARAILAGARDRSRERHLRSLHDQQQRDAPLTRARPARRGRSSEALAARAAKAKAAAAAKDASKPRAGLDGADVAP